MWGGVNFWAAKKHAVISPDKVSGNCASNSVRLFFRILLVETPPKVFFASRCAARPVGISVPNQIRKTIPVVAKEHPRAAHAWR